MELEEQRKFQVMRGDGEMATLMRNLDWSKLPAGPVSEWPEALRTAVSICLGSRHAVEIWWGPEYLRFYNDAYRPILGANKHPQFIGRPGQEMWAEIWDVIEPLLREVCETGVASWYEDFQLFVTRNGFLEETYFSFSYGPIYEEGKVAGIFSPCTETTAHVLQNRRLRLVRQISVESVAETLPEAIDTCTRLLGEDAHDVPFATVYLFDPQSERATLASSTGLDQAPGIFPNVIDLSSEASHKTPFGDLSEITRKPVYVDDLDKRFGAIHAGPWNEKHRRAKVLPLRRAASDTLAGILVVGISSRLPYTGEYRIFLDLLASQISNVIARTAALLEERQRTEDFARMFNGAPAFIAVLRGSEHTFEMVNPRYQQVAGHRELIGKTIRTAFPELAGQGIFELLDKVYQTKESFHGDSIKLQLQRTPDSPFETRYLTFVYEPLTDTEGRVTGIFVLGSDVSENVAAHEALRRSEKLSAAGRLAATIAHEVNNPLEAITNLLYLAKTGEPHEIAHFLDLAEEELARIAHITKQTLAFYKESTAPGLFDMSRTVESILVFYRKQAATRGIEIRTDLKPGCTVMGVEGEIKQVLSNLLSNAMDAFAGDSGRIRIRTCKLLGSVRLVVADTGHGIPPDALARIWEPFFTTKEAVGTGLGLWVTREILGKHNARLRLRTTSEGKKRGTTFVIDFPLAEKVVIN